MTDHTTRQLTPGTTSAEERRHHVHAMWSAVAGSWAEYADDTDARHAPETAAMLAATAPVPGDHVLELAAGAGGLGLAVADLVAPGGRVVISDVAVEMTAAARARVGTREAVEVRPLDIESIAEPDSSYDVVLCRHGLQFAVDPSAASREIARVLRPGGRLAASVWGPAAANPWLSVVMEAAQSVLGRPVPPPGIPGPFALSEAGHLAGLLEAVGLARVEVSEISEPLTAADFDGWWTWTTRLAGPLTKILSSLDEQAATAIRERARASLADHETEHGYHLPGLALVVSARRP